MKDVLMPIIKFLKANSLEINMGLLVIILFSLFPIINLISNEVKLKLKNHYLQVFSNVYIKVSLCLLLISIYFSGNIHMLVLILYILLMITLCILIYYKIEAFFCG